MRLYGAIRRGKQAMIDIDELTNELWKIDKNLIRAELTNLERGEHLKRRREIFDAKGAEKIPTPGGEQTVGFDKSVSLG